MTTQSDCTTIRLSQAGASQWSTAMTIRAYCFEPLVLTVFALALSVMFVWAASPVRCYHDCTSTR
jgi:hypothetical protein